MPDVPPSREEILEKLVEYLFEKHRKPDEVAKKLAEVSEQYANL